MAQARRRATKRAVVILAAFLTVAGGGVAYAFWTSTGSGTGLATTGVSTPFTITAADAEGEISPGSLGETVDFTVTNPGPGTLYLNAVTVTLADEDGVAWTPPVGCLFADYTVAVTTAPDPGAILATESVTGTATVRLTSTDLDQNACQTAEVPLYFVAS